MSTNKLGAGSKYWLALILYYLAWAIIIGGLYFFGSIFFVIFAIGYFYTILVKVSEQIVLLNMPTDMLTEYFQSVPIAAFAGIAVVAFAGAVVFGAINGDPLIGGTFAAAAIYAGEKIVIYKLLKNRTK